MRNRWFSIQVLVLVELYGFSVVLREPSCTIRVLGFVFHLLPSCQKILVLWQVEARMARTLAIQQRATLRDLS